MSLRILPMAIVACSFLAAGAATGTEVAVITLDGIGDVACDDVWTEAGLDIHFTTTAPEDCDGGGSCSFGTDPGEAWLYPGRLVVDFAGSRQVEQVEVFVVDWCGTGCTQAFLYEGGVMVDDAGNTVGGGTPETLTLIPSGGTADRVAVSSCEGQVTEIRISFGDAEPGGCTSTADCGSFELCVDGECVETWPCEVDGDCDAGWACLDGYCQPGEPMGCDADGDCAEGEVCIDGLCVEESGGPECAADAECSDGEYCVAGACYVAATEACESDGDCGGGWQCVEGECSPGAGPDCAADADCAAGESCVYGECLGGCTADADCTAGAVCVDGACVDQGDAAACASDTDCAEGALCVNGVCLAGCITDAGCGGDLCLDGKCVAAPVPECAADADCGPGFVCGAGACAPEAAEPGGGDGPDGDADSDDSGGSGDCSVGSRAAPMSGLWLLLLAGLLVLRRTRTLAVRP
jgi:hypothetical protein